MQHHCLPVTWQHRLLKRCRRLDHAVLTTQRLWCTVLTCQHHVGGTMRALADKQLHMLSSGRML